MNIIYVAALMFFYRTRTFEVRFEVHENNTDQIWRVISVSRLFICSKHYTTYFYFEVMKEPLK